MRFTWGLRLSLRCCACPHLQAATSPAAKCLESTTSSKSRGVRGTAQQQQCKEDSGCDEAARVSAILAAAAKPPLAGTGVLTPLTAAAAGAIPGAECTTGTLLQHVVPQTSSQQLDSVATKGELASTEHGAHTADGGGLSTSCTPHPHVLPTAAASTASASVQAAAAVEGSVHQDSSRTEYARRRPRRECAGQRSIPLELGSTRESLELVTPLEFIGPVGTSAAGAQPYRVDVDLQVCFNDTG